MCAAQCRREWRLRISGERPATEAGGHNTTEERAGKEFFRYDIECRLLVIGLDRRLIPPSKEELARAVAGALDYRFNLGHMGQTRIAAVRQPNGDEGLEPDAYPHWSFDLRRSGPEGETSIVVGADVGTRVDSW
eukprot:jgi/Tetstr1/465267/TSEL_009969.t1